MGIFILSCVLGFGSAVALFIKSRLSNSDEKSVASGFSLVLLVASLIAFVFSSTQSVSNGHIAVGSLFGDVKETTLSAGMHWPVNPLMSWSEHNVQLQTTEFDGRNHFQCLSKDSKEYFLEANVSWMEIPKYVYWVERNVKDPATLVAGAQRTGLRLAGGQFDLMELSANFEQLEKLAVLKSNEALAENIKKAYGVDFVPFIFTKVDIRKPELPESIQAAITDKLRKQQEAEGMSFILDKERKEAERKAIEAQGIADFQRIVSEGINERLLYWKYIEAMEKLAGSNNTTFIFAPDGRSMPFTFTKPVETPPGK